MPSHMRMKKSAAVYNSLLNDGSFTANQSETWDMINEKLSAHSVDSATASMGDIYDQEEDVIDDYMKHFFVLDNQAGMVVMINNQVIGSDCFARHGTLQRTFPKLVKSYVLDAIDADEKKKKYLSSSQKATFFLWDVGNCLVKERPSISLGTDIRLVSQRVIGSALSVDDEVVRLTAFARDEKETKRKVGLYQRGSRRKNQK